MYPVSLIKNPNKIKKIRFTDDSEFEIGSFGVARITPYLEADNTIWFIISLNYNTVYRAPSTNLSLLTYYKEE